MSAASVLTDALQRLIATVRSREPLGVTVPADAYTARALEPHPAAYANRNGRLGIDFTVAKLAFPERQTMDPRIVRIAPGANNERHRHAHESVFVVVQGEGAVLIGETWRPLRLGDVAFVPRWIFHQTRNTSPDEELVLVAITDFGFTSAILGDYDRRTRLAEGGADADVGPGPARARPRGGGVEAEYPRGWWRFITGKR